MQNSKATAAALAAVIAYIKAKKSLNAGNTAAETVNRWAASGRQVQMNVRMQMQLRAAKHWSRV